MQKSGLKLSRRSFIAASGLGFGALGLAGCMKKEPEGGGDSQGGTLYYYIPSPPSIDPFNAVDVTGNSVARQLFDPLTEYDFKQKKLVPLAAESWEANAAMDEFTFHVKKGNTFHNGETVDAAAFKRGWERVCSPKTSTTPSVISYYLNMIQGYKEMVESKADELSGVSCPDEYTLKVKLIQPFADFPYVCSVVASCPVPKVALEDFDKFTKAPIGNGPFMMDGNWEDGQFINLKRYEDYKNRDKAKLAAVNFKIFKDAETAYTEFKGGNLDFAQVPTSVIKAAISEFGKSDDGYTITPGKQVLLGEEPSTYFLTINLQDPVMKDVNLRRAMSLAINRQAICDTLFEGTRSPASDIIPPAIPGHEENAWPDAHFDRDAATAILDQHYPKGADGKRNVSIKLSYNIDGAHKQIMESVIADLNAVGINVVSDTKDWSSVCSDYDNATYQVGRLGWLAAYPSMDNYLYPLFVTGNGDNTARFSNPKVDEMIKTARGIANDEERVAKLKEANKLIASEVPFIPLMYYCHDRIGSKRIKYGYFGPMAQERLDTWELEG